MARGYAGQFGHILNAPYVWIPLALIFLVGLFDFRRPLRFAHLDLLVLLSFGISQVFFNSGDIGVSVPLAYPPLRLPLRPHALGRLSRAGRGGLRPSLPWRWLGLAVDRPGRLPDHDQHRRLRRDRRRLRRHDRRRPDHPRRDGLGRGRVPRRQPLRRHLRARQLLRLRAVRTRAAMERELGRAAVLARGGDRLRPRRGRSASSSAACGSSAGEARPPARDAARLRLGRLPVHDVRPAVELQRLAAGGVPRLVAGAVCAARLPAGRCWPRR